MDAVFFAVVVAAVFAVLSCVLELLRDRFDGVAKAYSVPAEAKLPGDKVGPLLDELRSMYLVVPGIVAVVAIFRTEAPGTNGWTPWVLAMSALLYIWHAVGGEYQRLYRHSRKTFHSGILSMRPLYAYGVLLAVALPTLAVLTCFAEDGDSGRRLFGTSVVLASLFSLWQLLSVTIPLERDARFIRVHKSESAILGEGLATVDDVLRATDHDSETQVRHIARILDAEFDKSLPRSHRDRARLVEFALNSSIARADLLDAVMLERCRRAAIDRRRLEGELHERGHMELVHIDVGAVRGTRVACVVMTRDPVEVHPPSLRCVHAGCFKKLSFTGEDSQVTVAPSDFWAKACAEEERLSSSVEGWDL